MSQRCAMSISITRGLIGFLCAILLLGAFFAPVSALAKDAETMYLDAEGKEQTAVATILKGDEKKLGSSTATEKWYVVPAGKKVTFKNRPAIEGNVHLILGDKCKLTAKKGIEVDEGSSFSIYAQSVEEETMGMLESGQAKGASSIGGEDTGSTGSIEIMGGNIIAVGGVDKNGYGLVAIGGADCQISILGGIVHATAFYQAAAIGSRSAAQSLHISGVAKVYAIGSNGPGIYGEKASILIEGNAVVNSTGYNDKAGIGGTDGEIIIRGNAQVIASSDTGSGIGGEWNEITIGGNAEVFATGGAWSAGIGGQGISRSLSIAIEENAKVTAISTEAGAGIGAGQSIVISGGTIHATGGHGAAGIGGKKGSNAVGIRITGGTLVAEGGSGAAGIGSGTGDASVNIFLGGQAVIQATGGDGDENFAFGGAGVGTGGGVKELSGSITIDPGEGFSLNAAGGKNFNGTLSGAQVGLGGGIWSNGAEMPMREIDADPILSYYEGGNIALRLGSATAGKPNEEKNPSIWEKWDEDQQKWQKVWGQTGESFPIEGATSKDSGKYRAGVGGFSGGSTRYYSQPVTVTVLPFSGSVEPSRILAPVNGNAAFRMEGYTPAANEKLVWQKRMNDDYGYDETYEDVEEGDVLEFTGVLETDGGVYRAVVKDRRIGNVLAGAGNVTLHVGVTAPRNRLVAAGQDASFDVTLYEHWRLFGYSMLCWQREINGEWKDLRAYGQTLTLADVKPEDAGRYRARMADSDGPGSTLPAVDMTVATTTVNDLWVDSITLPAGSVAAFALRQQGTPVEVRCQWLHFANEVWEELPGETREILTIPSLQPQHAGEYRVFVECNGETLRMPKIVVTVE